MGNCNKALVNNCKCKKYILNEILKLKKTNNICYRIDFPYSIDINGSQINEENKFWSYNFKIMKHIVIDFTGNGYNICSNITYLLKFHHNKHN